MLKNVCCTICLSINKITINVYNTDLQYVYENLANFKIKDNECWMCYICHTRLQQCHQLQQLAVQTRGLIDDIFQNKIDIKFGSFGSLLQLSTSKTMITNRTYNSSYIKEKSEMQTTFYNDNGLKQDAIVGNTNQYEVEVEGFPQSIESEDPLVDTRQTSSNMAFDDLQKSKVHKVKIENRDAAADGEYIVPSWISSPVTELYLANVGEQSRGHTEIKLEMEDSIERDNEQDNKNDYEGRGHASQARSGRKRKYKKPQTCDVCSRSFRFKSQLLHHKKIHTGIKPHSCHVCSKKFRQVSDLNKHNRIHTGERPFSCDLCLKNFKFKSDLLRHIKIHSGDKPFKCDICEKMFKNKECLNRHMKMHTGNQPFSCHICVKKFLYESDLQRHIKTHQTEKPFSCDLCSKEFKEEYNLDRHMRIHIGDQPFSCHICEKKFLYESNLQRHIKTHKREKPFSCDVCSNRFTEKHNLERHMRIHMGD